MKTAIIFHHQLFKVSEPFIVQQARQLRAYRPIYLGRERFAAPPVDSETMALEDLPTQRRFPARLWQVLSRDVRPYVRLLGNRRVALIHAHFGVDGVYALPLAQRLNVPLVTTFHGFDATTSTGALLRSGSPAWVNYRLFRGRLAQRGQLFLCISEFIRQRVLELGFPPERTHVHYIGIDTQAVQPRSEQEEQPIVLHVARLVEQKGTAFLLRAFAACTQRYPQFRLVIIGDGPSKPALCGLAQALGLSSRVDFLGALPHAEVMSWMRKASMLVLPSVSEGLGMVLLEAAATGVPSIGARHGGIPETIIDGQTGYLVPAQDSEFLGQRMAGLMQDRAMRFGMGAQARLFVESRFSMQKQTASLEAFYDGVLQ